VRFLFAILIFFFLALQYRLWVGEGSLAEVASLRREITAQEQEIERLRVRNRALHAEVEDLKTGLDAVEERARSELGMVKQGEVFYQVVEPVQRSRQ